MSQLWERTPIATSPLSVIVLLDNQDAETLRKFLETLQPILREHVKVYEVLVPVPAAMETAMQPALSACTNAKLVVNNDVSQGVGSALKTAIATAIYPLVFTIPVTYSPKRLPAFLKEIDQVDMVCGAREGKARGWKWRQFFSVAYQIYGLWMQDPECPVRLYRKEMFDRIPIQSKGSFAQIEILAKANFQSRLMTEVSIQGQDSDPARTSQDFWKVLNHPHFGQPPVKVVETPLKPIITTQAPEARV